MYQSPISIYETAMQTIMEQRENAIVAKVQDAFDVQVDKEELIRALQYDRNQYEAGYRDGKAEATPKWIPVSERFPEGGAIVLCNTDYFVEVLQWDKRADVWVDQYRSYRKNYVTHWMPLPEPPREDNK